MCTNLSELINHKTIHLDKFCRFLCCDSCLKKATAKKNKQQKEYNQSKEFIRLASRAHSIGVETLKLLEQLGKREHVCEVCGSTENLQCHHKNLTWLDNTPSNLQWLCTKCHSEVHSNIDKSLKEQGKDEYDLYEASFYPIISQVNKL